MYKVEMYLEESTLVIPLHDLTSLRHQQVKFGETDLTLTDAFLKHHKMIEQDPSPDHRLAP